MSVALFSCQKQEVQPTNFFNAHFSNKTEKKLSNVDVSIRKGITILAGNSTNKDDKEIIIITIRGEKEGTYKQEFDYKTSVSVTQCGLTNKIISSSIKNEAQYYSSYEGKVVIDKVDTKSKTITGHYNFKLRAIFDKENTKQVKGKFINLKYKK